MDPSYSILKWAFIEDAHRRASRVAAGRASSQNAITGNTQMRKRPRFPNDSFVDLPDEVLVPMMNAYHTRTFVGSTRTRYVERRPLDAALVGAYHSRRLGRGSIHPRTIRRHRGARAVLHAVTIKASTNRYADADVTPLGSRSGSRQKISPRAPFPVACYPYPSALSNARKRVTTAELQSNGALASKRCRESFHCGYEAPA